MNPKRNKYQFDRTHTQMSISFLLVMFVLILFASCTSLQNRKEKRQEKRDQICCEKCKYGDDFIYISLQGTYNEGDLDSLFASLELSYSSERKLPYKIPYLVKNNELLYKSMTVQEYNKRLSSPRILENKGDDKLKNRNRILEQLRKHSHISYAGPICCNEHDPIVTVGRILHFTYEGVISHKHITVKCYQEDM